MALSAAMLPATSLAAAPEAGARTAVVALRDSSVPADVTDRAREQIARSLSGAQPVAPARDEGKEKDALAKAAARAAKGRALYQNLDFEKAIPELEAARDAMIGALASQDDGALVDVLIDLGAVHADLNQAAAAREVFRQARTYGAPAELPATRPQKLRDLYKEAIAGMRADSGLDVTTAPAGAKVFVDGRPAGVAPAMVRGLVGGPHVVRAEIDGRRPGVASVSPAAGQVASVRLALPTPSVDDPAKGVDASNGRSVDDLFRSGLVLGASLGVDHLVLTGFVRPSAGAAPVLRTIVIDVPRGASLGVSDLTGPDAASKAASDAAAKIASHPGPAATPALSID